MFLSKINFSPNSQISFRPEIGKNLRVRLEGNADDVAEFYTIITNQNGIVYHKFHETYKKKLIIPIKITREMAPVSFLTIYYIQMTGEIVYDQVKLDIKNPFPLKVGSKIC